MSALSLEAALTGEFERVEIDPVSKAIERNIRKGGRETRRKMLALLASIHEEVNPLLENMRRAESLMHSGVSVMDVWYEKRVSPWQSKGPKPALPVIGCLPSNKVVNPRIK